MKPIHPLGRNMLKKKVLNATVPGEAVELTHPTDKLSAGLAKASKTAKEFSEKCIQTKGKAFEEWLTSKRDGNAYESESVAKILRIGFYAGYDACNIFKTREV